MSILTRIQADLSRWPGLVDPLDHPWHEMPWTANSSIWDQLGDVAVMCVCSTRRPGFLAASPEIPISAPPGPTYLSKRRLWDRVGSRLILVWIGQCGECLAVQYAIKFWVHVIPRDTAEWRAAERIRLQ